MMCTSGTCIFAIYVTSEPSILWHYQLGHASHRKLQLALPWFSVVFWLWIVSRRHHRACDIWGPTRVPSVSGHRYYIIFIDDYSRASWVYLLKDRSHILDVIKNFFNEIINQFSVTPKCLRTNNDLEFVQSGIQSYCTSLEVIHHTTCRHTSQ